MKCDQFMADDVVFRLYVAWYRSSVLLSFFSMSQSVPLFQVSMVHEFL